MDTTTPAIDLVDAATAPIIREYQGRPVRELYRAIRVSQKPDRWQVYRLTDGRPSVFRNRTKAAAQKEAMGSNLIASQPHHCQALVPCRVDASFPPVTCVAHKADPYGPCPNAAAHITTEAA